MSEAGLRIYRNVDVPSVGKYTQNHCDKMKVAQFLEDMDGIIRPGFSCNPHEAYETVKSVFIKHM